MYYTRKNRDYKIFFGNTFCNGVSKKGVVESLEIVKRTDLHTFKVLPKRWIVERTFARLGQYRRLSKDYESESTSSKTMIRPVMINLVIHRLEPG